MKPKPKRLEKKKKSLVDFKWVITIIVLAFFISVCFSLVSQFIIPNVYVLISIFLVLFFIFLGVLFDMVGVAVTVADPKVFNAMASKKEKGAKLANVLIKNAAKVSSICNDVVGDICGIVSGSCGATIATILVSELGVNAIIPSILITAIIASLTIGGKALGKGLAVAKANYILNVFSRLLSLFYKVK